MRINLIVLFAVALSLSAGVIWREHLNIAASISDASPKPPNCQSVSEVDNLRMTNGKLADVRILQSGDLKFYVPTSWFTNLFVDRYERLHHRDMEHGAYYHPQIDELECPGVVHHYIGKDHPFGFMTPTIDRIHNVAPVNISIESALDYISFGGMPAQSYMLPGSIINQNMDRISQWNPNNPLDSPKAIIVLEKNKMIAVYALRRNDYIGSPRWIDYRKSALILASWLRTPPSKRHNDQVFKLGTLLR